MTRFAALLILIVVSTPAHAADWPAWRGPTGQGFCEEKDIPVTWSDKENVKWKVPLENPGNSTPVVWGDKIFLTQANKGGSQRSLLCFARADGKLIWQRDVAYAEKEKNWNEEWYANASPVLDGERAVVSFGSAGMYCYDFDGKELWKRTDLGVWEHAFGNGSSPVLFGDLAILWCGPNELKGRNFLLAVNKKTGETVWQKERNFQPPEDNGDTKKAYSTPLVIEVGGKALLVSPSYIEAMREVLGGQLAPDANASLRVTYGTIKSFKPESKDPADWPFTVASQIPAKDTGKEPFNSPKKLLAAIKARNYGPYADPALGGELPIDFLSDLDITGGNSGSPTLNSKGELVGLAFDGTIEGVASDVVFNPATTRTISVDARYMIWTLDLLDGGDHLLKEMGLTPKLQ